MKNKGIIKFPPLYSGWCNYGETISVVSMKFSKMTERSAKHILATRSVAQMFLRCPKYFKQGLERSFSFTELPPRRKHSSIHNFRGMHLKKFPPNAFF